MPPISANFSCASGLSTRMHMSRSSAKPDGSESGASLGAGVLGLVGVKAAEDGVRMGGRSCVQ